MKLDEIYQPLKEFIFKGKVSPEGKTYVYLYERKYAIETPEPFNNIDFSVPKALLTDILTILAKSPEFNDQKGYNTWKPVLAPYKAKLEAEFLENTYLISSRDPELDAVFRTALTNGARDILDSMFTTIIYGWNIKMHTQAAALLQDVGNFPKFDKPYSQITQDDLNQPYNGITVGVSRPTQFLVIDHDRKQIYRMDRSAEYKSRMTTYARKTEYILVKSDFSIPANAFYKLTQDVKKRYPTYTVAHDTPQLATAPNKLQMVLNGRGSFTAYHGTSNAIYTKIKKDGRMMPGQGPDYVDKIQGHSENMIYLTFDPNVARRYAIRASGARPYVILEIQIDDISRLRFDEDSLNKAISTFWNSTRKNDIAVKRLLPDEWVDKETGKMKVDWYLMTDIIRMHLRGESEMQFPAQEKVINYIFYKTLIAMDEYSFAYQGAIPASKISVFEKHKTKKADGASDADYAEIEKGIAK
jgi:hypothetical protein